MATTYVSNFLQLRDAIEDGDSTEIIVQEDITFSSGGAKINAAKGEIVIDLVGIMSPMSTPQILLIRFILRQVRHKFL